VPPKQTRSPVEWVLSFLSSFGLATVTLIFLLIITLLGTLDQVDNGLFESQKKYFDAALVWGVSFGKTHIPIVLPGGFLLMLILTVNIILGAVRRIRKTPRKIGILIAHLSMIFLLVAGAVSFFFKKDGNMALFEGQTSDEFQSYHDSVIEIERVQPAPKDGKRTALIIPGTEYRDLDAGKGRVFTNDSLPFDLWVMNYMENATPRRVKPGDTHQWQTDGYYLQALPAEKDQEMNLDAAMIKIVDKKTKTEQPGLLWREEAAPFAFKIGDETYNIHLTRRSWKLPFAVKLDKFVRELHPGTAQARKFTSYVTKIQDKHEEKKVITMNAPLRDSGHILFQASFQQSQAGDVKRSVFAVVQNPADQWPLIALLAAALGLLIHMVDMLVRFLIRSSRQNRPASAVSSVSP